MLRFAMRLAVAMGKTLHTLGETMSASEFMLWIAREAFEPLANPWLQTGVQTAATLAPWVKKGKTPKPEDYMPLTKRSTASRRMNNRQMMAVLSTFKGVHTQVFDNGR